MLIKYKDMFCTFEQAKKLKDLGVKQSSYFYWSDDNYIFDSFDEISMHETTGTEFYSAYSLAEIDVMHKIRKVFPSIVLKSDKILCHRLTDEVIYLIDEKIITAEEINARFLA